MNKNYRRIWVKGIVFVIMMISCLVMCASSVGMLFLGTRDTKMQSRKQLQKVITRNMVSHYGAEILWGGENNGGRYDRLENGNLSYAVYRGNSLLYATDARVSAKDYEYLFSAMENSDYVYNINSFISMCYEEAKIYEQSEEAFVDIQGLVYDMASNLFYWKTVVGYFPVNTFYDEEWYQYTLNKSNRYYCEDKGIGFDYEDNRILYFHDVALDLKYPEKFYYEYEVLDLVALDMEQLIFKEKFYLVNRDQLAYTNSKQQQSQEYTVYMKVLGYESGRTFANGTRDYLGDVPPLVNMIWNLQRYQVPAQIISVLIFLTTVIFLIVVAGKWPEDEEVHVGFFDRMPFGIFTLIIGVLVFCGICANAGLLYWIEALNIGVLCLIEAEISLCWIALLGWFGMSLAVRIKSRKFWNYTVVYMLFSPLSRAVKSMRKFSKDYISLRWKLLLVPAGIFAFDLLAVAILWETGRAEMLFWFFLIKLLEMIPIMLVAPQIVEVYAGGERIARGDYGHPISTARMLPEIAEHAQHINSVGDGIQIAVQERMKSEHFRTELITNVSHDIKTPLTSIINYVDLMKKLEIKDETFLEYIEVLDHQSERLKKLITDLIEASKASTGNLKVEMEEVDAVLLFGQVMGEYEDKFREKNLALVTKDPGYGISIMADGRYLFRIYDNLMNNIYKYAQGGTRVYIDIDRMENDVVMTFRNTSSYPLNISAEELMMRFSRGDSSRHTEGSGLGLSIAQSLVTLMKGSLELVVDGDLFKVIMRFPISDIAIQTADNQKEM